MRADLRRQLEETAEKYRGELCPMGCGNYTERALGKTFVGLCSTHRTLRRFYGQPKMESLDLTLRSQFASMVDRYMAKGGQEVWGGVWTDAASCIPSVKPMEVRLLKKKGYAVRGAHMLAWRALKYGRLATSKWLVREWIITRLLVIFCHKPHDPKFFHDFSLGVRAMHGVRIQHTTRDGRNFRYALKPEGATPKWIGQRISKFIGYLIESPEFIQMRNRAGTIHARYRTRQEIAKRHYRTWITKGISHRDRFVAGLTKEEQVALREHIQDVAKKTEIARKRKLWEDQVMASGDQKAIKRLLKERRYEDLAKEQAERGK